MIRQQRLHHDFHLTEIMNPNRTITLHSYDNGSVGRKLTDKEFVELYPKQCNIFKEIFKEEYKALTKK